MLPYLPLIIIFAFALLHALTRPRRSVRPFTIAHRGGAKLAPENTLAAIRAGVETGASHIEIDIRRAADGVLVVIHDRDLSRVTGQGGKVDEMTSAEITQRRALGADLTPGPSPTGRGERVLAEDQVPILDSVLKFIAGKAVTLAVEVKDPARYPGIETQIVEALERTGTRQQVVVGSFDHAWLATFHAAAPDVPGVPIADWWTRMPAGAAFKQVDVDWRRVLLDPTFVRRMRGQGRHVLVWTVDSPALMRLLIWLGVEGITTNRPDLAQTIVGQVGK